MKALRRLWAAMGGGQAPIRGVHAETLLENFFIAAVATVLGWRFYLRLTGYPRIEVGQLHIAHVLWGGLLMLVAIILLMAFLDRALKEASAVIGGIGFGTFIDELGKFITKDNDYFFEPTMSLIYLFFVLLFFVIRYLSRRRPLTPRECFANALETAVEANVAGVDASETEEAFRLLGQCPRSEAVEHVKAMLKQAAAAPVGKEGLAARVKRSVARFYEYLAARWWFSGGVIGLFAFVSITHLYALIADVMWSWALGLWLVASAALIVVLVRSRRTRFRRFSILASAAIVILSILMSWTVLGSLKQAPLTLLDWAQFVFPGVSGVIVVAGFFLFPVSRLRAYRLFRLSILISIFFSQVLSFYLDQILALGGLLFDIAILLALRYMIIREEIKTGLG